MLDKSMHNYSDIKTIKIIFMHTSAIMKYGIVCWG